MTEDNKALARGLRHRKAELKRLILQMQTDRLHTGSVFRILNEELQSIEEKLKNSVDKATN